GKARSFKDLVLAVFKALNITPKIEYVEMPDQLKKQYQYFTQADLKKLRAVGYKQPMKELEEAIDEYVNFLESNWNYFVS
ncbi:MAG: ADP-L-glycero-D-mannoheptose-6-epimerase, partial [Caldimicrobium sp.]